ncbi:MAG: hypothetical protein R3F59_16135 [Myxococcota bacterium]
MEREAEEPHLPPVLLTGPVMSRASVRVVTAGSSSKRHRRPGCSETYQRDVSPGAIASWVAAENDTPL